MKCPNCDVEMQISNSKTIAKGDESPTTKTQIFVQQTLTCRNPQCKNFNKEVQKVQTELYGDVQTFFC